MAPTDGPSIEEIQPLKTWEELIAWKRPTSHVDEIVNGRELQPRYPPCDSSLLKTLVCHDMKGGYLDDRFISGSSNEDSYRFYHWSGIDLFVYFSHNLVTIPPPCWVSSAHLHGVRVMGTIITEWDAGENICRELLGSEKSVSDAVSQLVEIAKYHRFEGWLINIENKIEPEKVASLVKFVEQLTEAMKVYSPDSVVLWYDSVTIEGDLKWQNELNDQNRPFFDVCDGIFLNYTWTNDHLRRSYEASGGRNSDVYVGLDVFGRNFYEGGKFNTHKAMELARANNLSAAIFAQGWTYETQENFEEAEDKLWGLLSPYLFHHGPTCLPFETSFCQGIGKKKFTNGKCEGSNTWYNLCNQQHQPIWPHVEEVKMKCVTDEAYDGGGCLEITTSCPTTVRLFVFKIRWKRALLISITYKWRKPPVPISLTLECEVTSSSEKNTAKQRKLTLPLENTNRQGLLGTSSSTRNLELGVEEVVDDNVDGWTLKTFSVPEDGMVLKELGIQLEGASTLLIGHISIINICMKGGDQ